MDKIIEEIKHAESCECCKSNYIKIKNLEETLKKIDHVLGHEIGFYAKAIKTTKKINKGFDPTPEGGVRSKYGDGWNAALGRIHSLIYDCFEGEAEKLLEDD